MKSPESNAFFILHYASTITIIFDTAWVWKQQEIGECHRFGPVEHCTALMALHTFSALPKCVPILSKLGDYWNLSRDLIGDLDAFTCALYGRAMVSRVNNDLRLIRIMSCVRNLTSLRPPTMLTWQLYQHVS